MPEEKQAECLELSGCRGEREEEQGSHTAWLFPWKAAASEKCPSGPFFGKEMSQLTSGPLLMAVVSQVLCWKGSLAAALGKRQQEGMELIELSVI